MKSKRRLLSLILVFSMIAGLYPNSYVYAYSDTESLEVSSEETADEATTAYPAFHPEPVIMDGVEIKVSADEGVFPESAVLSVNKPKASEEKKIENIIEEERSGTENVAASYTYDIKVLDADGNELQPEDGQKVEVSFSMAEVSNTNLDTNVYHISEDKSGELSADTLHVSENDDTVTAETDGFSYYTVEFTYDEKQYVMEGDTSVALTDILSYVGITKADGNVATDSDVTAVSVSDESLFSASNESGVWIVTAHQAFHTDEWMKVTVDGVEYEIKITDSMQITITIESVTTTSDKGKTFMCFSLAPSYNELNNYNGGDGRPNWGLPRYSTSGDITITVDSMPDNLYFYVEYNDGGGGGTTGPIGTLSNGVSNTLTATYSYSSGWPANINITNATATIKYHVNKASDPSVTAPTLASGLTYTGSAKQLISSAGSTSGNNMQYGISSSNTTQPTSWYGSISDNNMKKTDVGTYYVWYKCDAVSNYNAVAATCVGSVSIAKASNPITYGPQSWSYKYATTAQTKTLNAATSAQGTVTYSLQSQKKGNNTVNYFTFNTSTRVLTAAKNTPTGTYTVVVRASAAGGSNYNSGTADSTITVTVNKAAGSISYGTPAVTKTYGDSAFTNALTKAGDGTVSYSSSNTSVASINSNGQVTIVGAGTATITATVADGTNYSYASKTAAYSLTVNRKAITIKANDQTITYGGTISTGTDKVTVNTLVSGNTLSTITLTPSTSGATTNGTITPGNAAIIKNNTDVTNNYEISYQNGKLVIDKANISPAVNITGWTYGEYSPEINSPSVTGNTGNGAVTYEYKVKDAADNTYTASVPTDAGNYTVRATIAETSNYNGRTATKDFTISNAAMSVTANGYNDTYDGQAHGITAVAPEGATIKYRTSDSGAYNLTDNPQYTDAGTYTVYYQITKPNYTTVTGSETVVINKKQLELSWDDSTRAFTYDGSSHKPSASITGVLGDDDCGVAVSGEQTDYSVSAYTATASLTGEQKDNYVLPTEHTTTFTIAKADQTAPDEDTLTVIHTSSDSSNDGVISGVNDTMEYSLDGGTTWLPIAENVTAIDNLPIGDVKLRYKGTDVKNASAAITVNVHEKETQDAPLATSFTVNKATGEDIADGSISGFDSNKKYEYSIDDGVTWIDVADGSESITGLNPGNIKIRYKGNNNKKPSEAVTVVLGYKEEQAAPDADKITVTNTSGEGKTDGKITGVDDTMEYSTDGGKTWTPVEEGKTTIDDLASGKVVIRYKETADQNPGEVLKVTVKDKTEQSAPDADKIKVTNTSGEGKTDGKITGVDDAMEYSTDGGKTWTPVEEGKTSIDDLPSGEIVIRKKGTEDSNPGEVLKVIVKDKTAQSTPDKEKISVINASGEDQTDGVIKGVDDTMEYSLDAGKNWTPVEENQTEIDNLPVGDIEIRLKGDEDKNPGESLKVSIGVTSRTQGVVNFKTDDSTTPVETSVESAQSSNIEDYAQTQVEEGKDVKIELEITPRKEEDVEETSITEITKVSSEVFASIEAENIETEYLEIDLAKYVDNTKKGNISDTGTPLEIVLNYDSSKIGTPVVIRTHKGKAKVFEKLSKKPNDKFVDATYYVDNGKIYLYSQFFSDFALVYATKKTYYVNIDTGVGDPIVQVVGEDSTIELPTGLSKEGYGFGGWYKDADYKSAWDSNKDKVNEDTKIYAKWDKKVTGVSVSVDTVNLTKTGETSQITVTVSPSDSANKKVTYKSSNTKVATVDEEGKITAVANGTATITVTTEDGAKTATVKVTVAIPNVSKQGTSEQTTTEQPKTTEQPLQEPTKEEKAEISMNAGFKISQTGSKINIKWGKVKEADGYDVYVTYCGMDFNKKKPNKTLKKNSLVSTTITKINGKKINLKKNYKIYVVAYRMVEGKKVKLARTITGHIVGRLNTKYSNVRKITLSKSKYSVKVGKTVKVKAKTVLVAQSKKQLSDAHAAEFRYASSNRNIATVDKNGKVKGVAKGTCTIYVYARNGYAKTVSVTVK